MQCEAVNLKNTFRHISSNFQHKAEKNAFFQCIKNISYFIYVSIGYIAVCAAGICELEVSSARCHYVDFRENK